MTSPLTQSPPHGGGKRQPTEKQVFIWAEREQESGGNYQAVNPGSGALGAWQVMPSNLPGWLREAGLPQMTAYDYLHHPHAQDRLAWVILGGYFDRYGPRGAASMWYSGQPDWHKTYGTPPVYQYVADVIALMAKRHFPVNYGPAPGGPPFNLPPPPRDDWSATVRRTAGRVAALGQSMQGYADALIRLRRLDDRRTRLPRSLRPHPPRH